MKLLCQLFVFLQIIYTLHPTRRRNIFSRFAPACSYERTMPFAAPSRQRTPHVIANALIGMTAVLTTALVSASANHAEMLLAIPAFGIFLMIVLVHRQRQMNMIGSEG